MDSRRPLATLFALLVFLLFASCLFAQHESASPDSDHDGLSDALEQQLLEKFRPVFMIDVDECDVAPALIAPGSIHPIPQAKDGTIYGQAIPANVTASDGRLEVELHYYHLWSRDCGRMGHGLDAEHVSALVEGPAVSSTAPTLDASAWRALYWYAAAHEDTLCDASTAAKASVLHAEHGGPVVWISNGKHASFLNRENCRHGCGGDRCGAMKEAPRGTLINVGEKNAPMNGAVWINSTAWPMPQKLQPDFDSTLVTQIDALSTHAEIIPVSSVPGSVRAVIGAGNATVNGIDTGNEHTGSALSVGARKTWKALGTSYRSVKKALTPPDDEQKEKK